MNIYTFLLLYFVLEFYNPAASHRKECVGKHDIPFLKRRYTVQQKYFKPINWHKFEATANSINLTNDGITLLIKFKYNDPEDIPTISDGPMVGKGKYQLDHLYINWLTKNPKKWDYGKIEFPNQLHMVFHSTNYTSYQNAKMQKDGLTILSFGFKVNPYADNKGLEFLSIYMHTIKRAIKSVDMKPEHLFPPERLTSYNLNDFFTYTGSFLAPPDCLADVIWIDFVEPLEIKPNQTADFYELGTVYEKRYETLEEHHNNPLGIIYRAHNTGNIIKFNWILLFISIFNKYLSLLTII